MLTKAMMSKYGGQSHAHKLALWQQAVAAPAEYATAAQEMRRNDVEI